MNHWIDNQLVLDKTAVVHNAMINHEFVDKMILYSKRYWIIKYWVNNAGIDYPLLADPKSIPSRQTIPTNEVQDYILSEVFRLIDNSCDIQMALYEYSEDIINLQSKINSRYESWRDGREIDTESYSIHEETLHLRNCRQLDDKISHLLLRDTWENEMVDELWYIKDELLDYVSERRQFPHTLSIDAMFNIWLEKHAEIFSEDANSRAMNPLLPINLIKRNLES